jgi:hypothetical protein
MFKLLRSALRGKSEFDDFQEPLALEITLALDDAEAARAWSVAGREAVHGPLLGVVSDWAKGEAMTKMNRLALERDRAAARLQEIAGRARELDAERAEALECGRSPALAEKGLAALLADREVVAGRKVVLDRLADEARKQAVAALRQDLQAERSKVLGAMQREYAEAVARLAKAVASTFPAVNAAEVAYLVANGRGLSSGPDAVEEILGRAVTDHSLADPPPGRKTSEPDPVYAGEAAGSPALF